VSKVGERAERLISPELQAARIDAYAREHGLEVEHLPPELDVSGAVLERPILDDALEHIARGEAAGLIVAQLDRLSRAGILDTHRILRRVEEAGGKVIAVAEAFDDSTPEGRMARNVMLSLGEMQRERVRGGFAQARRQAVERGIWPSPHVPVGYRRGADRRLVPGEAERVVRAFEARARGVTWKEVAAILGVSDSGAQYAIRNRAYLGEVRMTIDGEPIVNSDAHPPLVGRALFEAAQLDHPRPPRGKGGPALLAGLVRCAGCQRAMSPTRRAYNCTSECSEPATIDRARIEPYVEAIVVEHLRGLRYATRNDTRTEAQALADAEAELVAYQRATAATGIGVEAFAEGLRERHSAVESARVALGGARGREAAQIIDAAREWPKLSIERKRHVLSGALDVIWVRSAHKRTLPGAERVKLVVDGPAGLSRMGVRGPVLAPVVWEAIEDALEGGREGRGEG
jgi:DNA invertase Pin-like site-specific DNA recombinase